MTVAPNPFQQVLNVVHQYFAALDTRDWRALGALHADTISFDYNDDAAETSTSRADLVALTASLLDPTEFSQHTITNEVVTIDEKVASVTYYETVVLFHSGLGEELASNTWTFYVRGEMRLQRWAESWRVDGLKVRRVHSSGNSNFRNDIAQL